MGSLEAQAKGSDTRYLGDKSQMRIAQGVSGTVADKGSVLRLVPFTMHAVKQGFQDLGLQSISAARGALSCGNITMEVRRLLPSRFSIISYSSHFVEINIPDLLIQFSSRSWCSCPYCE